MTLDGEREKRVGGGGRMFGRHGTMSGLVVRARVGEQVRTTEYSRRGWVRTHITGVVTIIDDGRHDLDQRRYGETKTSLDGFFEDEDV